LFEKKAFRHAFIINGMLGKITRVQIPESRWRSLYGLTASCVVVGFRVKNALPVFLPESFTSYLLTIFKQ